MSEIVGWGNWLAVDRCQHCADWRQGRQCCDCGSWPTISIWEYQASDGRIHKAVVPVDDVVESRRVSRLRDVLRRLYASLRRFRRSFVSRDTRNRGGIL